MGHGRRLSGAPAGTGPGTADETSDDDHRVHENDERLDHACSSFVPGVRSFNDPAGAGLQRKTLPADHAPTPEHLDQRSGLRAVLAGVQINGNCLEPADTERCLSWKRRSFRRAEKTPQAGHVGGPMDSTII